MMSLSSLKSQCGKAHASMLNVASHKQVYSGQSFEECLRGKVLAILEKPLLLPLICPLRARDSWNAQCALNAVPTCRPTNEHLY